MKNHGPLLTLLILFPFVAYLQVSTSIACSADIGVHSMQWATTRLNGMPPSVWWICSTFRWT